MPTVSVDEGVVVVAVEAFEIGVVDGELNKVPFGSSEGGFGLARPESWGRFEFSGGQQWCGGVRRLR